VAIFDQIEGSADADMAWIRTVDRALRHTPTPDITLRMESFAFDRTADPGIIRSRRTPPLGIFSVGLVRNDGRWTAGMLVMDQLAPRATFAEPTSLENLDTLRSVVSRLAGTIDNEVLVVGIPPPTESYASVIGAMHGALGTPVRLPDGRTGALTAGHVARTVGATVQVGSLTGQVVYSNHRHLHQRPVRCADVAVLALDDGWRTVIPVPQLAGTGAVAQLDVVDSYNLSGTGHPGQVVRFLGESFPMRETEGAWGDFFMVDAISRQGDSGAIAFDEHGDVVGQIVGGADGSYSIVQEIDYLLDDAGVTFDP
jgi:hypothetical protein